MIAFSGLDGAGKSTQIKLIKEYWNKQDKKVIVLWSRGGYTPGIELFKSLLRKSKNVFIPEKGGNSEQRKQSFSNFLVRKIWLSFAIIDLIYYYSFYIKFKELFGTKVICDRYIQDTLIDFKLNFPQENVRDWYLWRVLNFIAAKPYKHFVLTISSEESHKRSKLKNEPFPDSKNTLEKRLKDYLDFVSYSKFAVHIDCEQSIDLIHNIIVKELIK